MLYCATNESLAMLELRVCAPHPYPRERLRFIIMKCRMMPCTNPRSRSYRGMEQAAAFSGEQTLRRPVGGQSIQSGFARALGHCLG